MRHLRLLFLAAVLPLVLTSPPATAQTANCTGVAAWSATTLYQPGDRVVFQGTLYQSQITGANIPPNYCPSCGWWTNLGACGGGAADTTPPSVPTGLSSPTQTASSISLGWSASTDNAGGSGVAGYEVLRNGTVVGSPTTTSFTDAGLAASTTFSYAVRARDNAGNRSALSAAISVATLAPSACRTLPSVPAGLRAKATTRSSVSLSWNASTPGANCTSLVYRVFQNGVQAIQVSPTSATISGLPAATTFQFTVAAMNEFGTSAQSAPLSVTTASGGGGSAWPSRVFAPYIDVTLNTPALTQLSATTGSRFYTLAFIVDGGGCSAEWGGQIPLAQNYMLSDINSLRAAGGNVIVSFGGAAGTELGLACSSVASLQAQYQAVIDRYSVTWLDFDIEGDALDNTAANDRRNKAIAGLQATAASHGRELRVSYTLPVAPTGLLSNSLSLLQNAVSNGTHVDVVNIMTMDYGGPQDMGRAAVTAAQGTFSQIKPIFTGKTDAQLWKMMGNTPMIGVNDETVEVFSLANAQTLLSFCQQQDTGLIAFWDTWRDFQCPSGTAQPSDTCSGVSQSPNAFTNIFKAFTR
jgi:chitodextrinase